MFQTKEQDNTSEKDNDEMEISSLLNKEFKVMVVKMQTKVRRKMDEWSKKVNKEIENKENIK